MKSLTGPSWHGVLLALWVGAGAACSSGSVLADGGSGADTPAERNDTGSDAGRSGAGTGGGGAGTGGAGSGIAGTGGAGSGIAGTGGAGSGTAGTGGAGSGGQTEVQLPGCLRDLFAACPITGACTYQPSDAGTSPRLCHASGATSVTTGSVCSTSGGGQTIVVNKADGSVCYSLYHVANTQQACEVETYKWSNATNTTIATATLSNSGIRLGCGGSGETLLTPNWAAASTLFGPGACTPGTCP